VVAEGIETQRQLSHLRALGCPWGQGFLFSPPVEHDELADLLARSAERPSRPAARRRRDAA
jgi:EAL domain-containing protein (putative c-di-GMP-specific phosphodiesterase class I)